MSELTKEKIEGFRKHFAMGYCDTINEHSVEALCDLALLGLSAKEGQQGELSREKIQSWIDKAWKKVEENKLTKYPTVCGLQLFPSDWIALCNMALRSLSPSASEKPQPICLWCGLKDSVEKLSEHILNGCYKSPVFRNEQALVKVLEKVHDELEEWLPMLRTASQIIIKDWAHGPLGEMDTYLGGALFCLTKTSEDIIKALSAHRSRQPKP